MDFKHAFITLLLWQIVVIAFITNTHHLLTGHLYVFVKCFEMVVFLAVPLFFWGKFEALATEEDTLEK